WEAQKAAERAAKAEARGEPTRSSALDGVGVALPALTRAAKIQARAARVGFDWPEAAPVLAKIGEEIDELREAMAEGGAKEKLEEEAGDLLFAVVNLARHLGVDSETALRQATAKFERRFRRVEQRLAEAGRAPGEASLDEMEDAWQ